MESWQANKLAEKSISEKLYKYHTTETIPVVSERKYSSYAEAEAKGDISEMLGFKLESRKMKKADLYNRSNEYSALPLTEIQNRIKITESSLEKASDISRRMYENQYKSYEKEFSKIGGCSGVHLEHAILTAIEEYVKNDTDFRNAEKDVAELKTELRALKNAKAIWIDSHKDLIEAERVKALQADLRASGLLEELSIYHWEESKNAE